MVALPFFGERYFFSCVLYIFIRQCNHDVRVAAMKTWSNSDVAGFVFLLFGVLCLIFSNSYWLTSISLLMSALILLHAIYDARYEVIKYRDMLCHYQAALSSADSGWVAWNAQDEYVGASKKFKSMFGLSGSTVVCMADILASVESDCAEDLGFYFDKLKKTGMGFRLTVVTRVEEPKTIEIVGCRMIISNVETILLWCNDISNTTSTLSSMENNLAQEQDLVKSMRDVLNSLPIPVWLRNDNLDIIYCNTAYADAVERSVEQVVKGNIPLVAGSLFGQGHSLAENAKKCNREQIISQFVIINGERKKLSIHEMPISDDKFMGFALDVTAEDKLASDLDRAIVANHGILEHISSAVAIFQANTRLAFFNSTYANIMKLEPNWLHSNPTLGEIMDELRDNRQLPEHADYQVFKKEQLALFSSITDVSQELLHLPSGRCLRQLIAPYHLGGLVFIYEDVTDSLDMQRKNNTLLAVHRETLEHLYEGVMVYGSDNRLKLMNSSLAQLWKLDVNECKNIHILDMLENIKGFLNYGDDWNAFLEHAVSNLTDRISKTGKLLKNDGTVILFNYIPLPDGAHMHTFMDITDTCLLERAIMEKNQALHTAQKMRFEFIYGVSTELKDPLNLLIGFSELLLHEYYGNLNDKQIEYCKVIVEASNQLHQLITNLLEMVEIDIDSPDLNLSDFDIIAACDEVIANLDKRIMEKNIEVVRNYCESTPLFRGDKTRIKQALFNILLNAVQITPPDGSVQIMVHSDENHMKIVIKDSGVRVTKREKEPVFRRMKTHVHLLTHEESGISMPFVRSLIELHGGTLNITSDIDGTCVVCTLPIRHVDDETQDDVTSLCA